MMIYKKSKQIRYEGVDVCLTATVELKPSVFSSKGKKYNGAQDFSITAEGICTHGKRTGPRKGGYLFRGCCHEQIAEHMPELIPFIKLHLRNEFGKPMHVTNIQYFINEGKKSDEWIMSECDITAEQLQQLKAAAKFRDGDYFNYVAYTSGATATWEQLAHDGIALLEDLTGECYEPTTDLNLMPCYMQPKWLENMEQRVKSGEFTDEAFKTKQFAVRQKWAAKERAELKKEQDFYNRKFEIAEWLIENCPTTNYSYFAGELTKTYRLTLNSRTWEPPFMTTYEIDFFMLREDFPMELEVVDANNKSYKPHVTIDENGHRTLSFE